MAVAAAGRPAAPRALRIIQGQGVRADGTPTDSGGRAIEEGVAFTRRAPSKPDHLSDDASWLWDQVVDQLESVGLLKPIDGPALEIVCETFARWRDAVRMRKDQGTLATNSQGRVTAPWVGIEERASKEFRSWCAEFGFTPAAEKNLPGGHDGQSDDNPF